MDNKRLAIHLFSLFLFVGGCVVFWMLGGDEAKDAHVETSFEVSQQTKTESESKETLYNIGNRLIEKAEGGEEQTSHNTSIDNGDDNNRQISPSSFYAAKSVSGPISTKNSEKKDDENSVEPTKDDMESSPTREVDNKGGFHRMGETGKSEVDNSISVVVHEVVKGLNEESQVKLRLMDDVDLDGVSLLKNTVVYAKVRITDRRINMSTESVIFNNNVYPFITHVYDLDGEEGIAINSLTSSKSKITLPSGYRMKIRRQ